MGVVRTSVMTTKTKTAHNLEHTFRTVHRRIAEACARSGRSPAEVTLVAVSKTIDAQTVEQAAHLPDGLACHLFGENRVQELTRKLEQCPDQTFHMIGTLQRNKVRHVVGNVALIHSVDSLRLLEAIDAAARARELVQDVLLQVNVSEEASKQGFEPDEVAAVLEYTGTLESVRAIGLMTMAPLIEPEQVRPYFAQLRELAYTLQLPELSMGMSNDYEVAIEEGATLIRVGSALFGA